VQGQGEGLTDQLGKFLDRRWRLLILLVWLLFAVWLVYARWNYITGFVLTDTDDNMRIAQVRALLAGQDWYDLRQYKMNWPTGANMHWSRLVDLPLAGLILLGRMFMTGPHAEQMAVAVAPLIPLLLLLVSVTLTVRRLISPAAWPLAVVCLFFAGSTMGMFQPTRIDHHNWQLALLALGVAGIADPRRARGGAALGIATALSLSIGLEMLIYFLLAAGAMTLFWIRDAAERRRLATYAAAMAGGTALGFLLFASNANRLAVCDALSQVWLSDALLGGALLLALAAWSPPKWQYRLCGAALAGAAVAAFHALAWPHCLSRLEGVSPELYELWLSHVREARPIYSHGWRTATAVLGLPVAGLIGWGVLAWMARGDWPRLQRVLGAMLPAFAALALLFWQTRTGPAAQMLAIPGAVALVWYLAPRAFRSKYTLVRVIGTSLIVLAGLGAAAPLVLDNVPRKKSTTRDAAIANANNNCPSLWAMKPVAEQPAGTVFTFGDLAPRVISVTHHRSIIGPYHRNGQQILDMMHAFRGSPERARAIMAKYKADYLLICPMMSQSTVFKAEAPNGFYAQLDKGQVPAWLQPVNLGPKNPMKMWRVVN
jgi:hypothetical protein